MKNGCLIWAIAAIVLVIVVAGWYVSGLNRVVRLDENVAEKWAQVDTALKRRYDLIPNLINTVKGYTAHEKGIFIEVTKLRSQWAGAATKEEKMKAASGLEGALSRLLLVVENYPDLKASENFLNLQAQLEGTENRIAFRRGEYNKAVKYFNTYIRGVFGSFFAGKRDLTKPATYFEIEQKVREVPKVEFE